MLRCVCWVLADVSDVCVCSGGCTSPGPLLYGPDGCLCPLGLSICPAWVLLGLGVRYVLLWSVGVLCPSGVEYMSRMGPSRVMVAR